jgi:hypothetical protein
VAHRLELRAYLDIILKRFNMDLAKKGFLLMSLGISLGRTQCPVLDDE